MVTAGMAELSSRITIGLQVQIQINPELLILSRRADQSRRSLGLPHLLLLPLPELPRFFLRGFPLQLETLAALIRDWASRMKRRARSLALTAAARSRMTGGLSPSATFSISACRGRRKPKILILTAP
mmetsp:Transcript_1896/g.5001  ORF Transcript_1896/g.5001 Transcript_1896/m.5001 type:complete len:127 (-) Transcript_1896:67-447(-)